MGEEELRGQSRRSLDTRALWLKASGSRDLDDRMEALTNVGAETLCMHTMTDRGEVSSCCGTEEDASRGGGLEGDGLSVSREGRWNGSVSVRLRGDGAGTGGGCSK